MNIECMKDSIMQEDIEKIVNGNCPLDELKNAKVFVTGATGLLGSQIVKTLCAANRMKGLSVTIYVLVRSKDKAQKVFGELLDRGDIILILGDVNSFTEYDVKFDYVIHTASPTSSKYFVTNPVETILTAIEGTKNVLELAKKSKAKGMVYLSSLEVYGVPTAADGLVSEKDYGYIDPLSVRSSYSEGKRMVECLCASYAEEYGVPVKIARLSQTFGAGVEYNDGRVFAEFARCAMEQRNIVLHTAGNTLRTYCYTRDAVSAILTILVKGESGEAYNVTNKDTAVTIKEMAQCVCDIWKDQGIQVEFDMPDNLASFGYNPEMVIRLDTTKLEQLGWKAEVDLENMFIRMVDSFKQ